MSILGRLFESPQDRELRQKREREQQKLRQQRELKDAQTEIDKEITVALRDVVHALRGVADRSHVEIACQIAKTHAGIFEVVDKITTLSRPARIWGHMVASFVAIHMNEAGSKTYVQNEDAAASVCRAVQLLQECQGVGPEVWTSVGLSPEASPPNILQDIAPADGLLAFRLLWRAMAVYQTCPLDAKLRNEIQACLEAAGLTSWQLTRDQDGFFRTRHNGPQWNWFDPGLGAQVRAGTRAVERIAELAKTVRRVGPGLAVDIPEVSSN
jgi:hypothetical protein